MHADPISPQSSPAENKNLAERLERGEVVECPVCPFTFFSGDDHAFLLDQQLGRGHKNISYDPTTGKAGGFARKSSEQAARMRTVLASFAQSATAWMEQVLSRY